MIFAGTVAGSGVPDHVSCERGGKQYQYFSVLMAGSVGGKSYFMRLNAYPYYGPGAYKLVAPPPVGNLYHGPTPGAPRDPLSEGNPGVGYLNFIPKWEKGNAYSGSDPRGRSTLTVEAGEQSGSLLAEMVSEAGWLRVAGAFVCGPPFTI
jgi:hypothetical protein